MKYLILSIAILFSASAWSVVELAGGYSSYSAGHKTPELTLGAGGSDWLMSGSSSGYKTTAYFHSQYVLRYYKTWNGGDFFWGKVSFGAGGGVMYSVRGFADTGAAEEKANDLVLGPALRAKWNFAGPVFLAVDGVFGIGQLWYQALALNFQDVVTLSVGVSAW